MTDKPTAAKEPPWGWGRKLSPAERLIYLHNEREPPRPDDPTPWMPTRAAQEAPWQHLLDEQRIMLWKFKESLRLIKGDKE